MTLPMDYHAICTKPDTHRPQVVPQKQLVADVPFQCYSSCLALPPSTLICDENGDACGPGTKALTG